ncbi:MAG TPA: class I SAM-dependent methyltransferase [Methylomirabilota bacterium]|nr:class I SAM-dependent methyltransferase [Methylomirabilota bacterium]
MKPAHEERHGEQDSTRPAACPRAAGRRAVLWTDRTAAWYRRAAERGDYAERVLAAVGPRLAACRTALDVGAGCGALAIPLARRGIAVTALEPSAAMARALRRWAADAGVPPPTVVEAAWGEVPVGRHDLVLCAHVGNLLRTDSGFLREIGRVARRAVVLVRDLTAARGGDKFFYRELYPILLGRPYDSGGAFDDPVDALRALGIRPEVTEIEYRSDQPFDDLSEACDFWMTYLGRSDEKARAYLAGFLRERLVRDGEGWVAPFRKAAAVITWGGPS